MLENLAPSFDDHNSQEDINRVLVRHFLIEGSQNGWVQVAGSDREPIFSSLTALIHQHAHMPLSLPIKLNIPVHDITTNDVIENNELSTSLIESEYDYPPDVAASDSGSDYLDPRTADPGQDQQTSNTAPRDDQRGASPDYNNPPDDSAYLETFDSGSRDVGYVFPSDYILKVYK